MFYTYAFPPEAGNRQWAGTATTFGTWNTGVWNNQFGITLRTEYFSIQFSGYFYASATGTYTFSMASDDAAYFWIGSIAATPGTTNTYSNQNLYTAGSSGSVGVVLSSGVYYSVMIMYGQAPGALSCSSGSLY